MQESTVRRPHPAQGSDTRPKANNKASTAPEEGFPDPRIDIGEQDNGAEAQGNEAQTGEGG